MCWHLISDRAFFHQHHYAVKSTTHWNTWFKIKSLHVKLEIQLQRTYCIYQKSSTAKKFCKNIHIEWAEFGKHGVLISTRYHGFRTPEHHTAIQTNVQSYYESTSLLMIFHSEQKIVHVHDLTINHLLLHSCEIIRRCTDMKIQWKSQHLVLYEIYNK